MGRRILIVVMLMMIFMPGGFAQNGYMGKKFNFYLKTRLNPSWIMANRNEEMGLFKFDPWWAAGIDVIVSSSNSIGSEYHFYKTKYPSDFSGGDDPSAYSDIDVRGIGVFWKHYFSLNAPMGHFSLIQLDYYKYEAVGINGNTFESPMFGLQIGWGRTYVIKNYVSLTPAFSTGLAFGKGMVPTFSSDFLELDDVGKADRKVRHMNYINISVTIGLLAF